MRKIAATAVFVLLFSMVSCTTADTAVSDDTKMVLQGNEFAKDGLFREAALTYKNALKRNPKNQVATRNLGIVEIRLRNYSSGVTQLEKIARRFDSDFDTNFWLAEGYRATDRYGDAIFRYKKALAETDDNARALKGLAWSYYKVRFYTEALAIAEKIQKKNPEDAQNAMILARIQIKVGQQEKALELITNTKSRVSTEFHPYLLSVQGDALLAMNKYSDALTIYKEALRGQPLLPGPLLGLGKCYLSAGKTSEAIGYLERAVRIKPTFTEAVYLLAGAYENKNPKKSRQFYTLFSRLATKDPEFVGQINEANQKMARLSK